MSNSFAIYDQFVIQVNGRYLDQCTGLGIDWLDSGEMQNLLGGGSKLIMVLSPGKRVMKIQWDMVVPTTDTQDLKFIRKWKDVEVVNIGVDLIGSKLGLLTKGVLQDPKFSAHVGKELQYSISAICQVADFG